MIPLAFVVALAGASLVVLAVAAVALGKQATRLASTLSRFQDEMRPVLEAIQSDADRAAAHMERLRSPEASPGAPSGADAREPDAPR